MAMFPDAFQAHTGGTELVVRDTSVVKIPQGGKDGDWECPRCQQHCFAKREVRASRATCLLPFSLAARFCPRLFFSPSAPRFPLIFGGSNRGCTDLLQVRRAPPERLQSQQRYLCRHVPGAICLTFPALLAHFCLLLAPSRLSLAHFHRPFGSLLPPLPRFYLNFGSIHLV